MILYFSGLASATEAEWLREAGIRSVLVDPDDAARVTGFDNIMFDSGAYRAWKKGTSFNWPAYLSLLEANPYRRFIAPDVVGDGEATWANWQRVKHLPNVIPVWQWDTKRRYLPLYLDKRQIVAIGGLVPSMRAKDAAMLAALKGICELYPNRFHILGNWLWAIETLRDLVWSGDTSKFLDGARYGSVIFINTKTGRLSQAPAKAIPQYRELDRKGRCISSATEMRSFCGLEDPDDL